MSSIRTRVANRFAALLLVAVGVFAATVWAARQAGAYTDLERIGRQRADIVLQLVRNASTQNFLIDRDARIVAPLGVLKNFLDAQPGYLTVYDADGREIYRSPSISVHQAFQEGEEPPEVTRADAGNLLAAADEARQGLSVARFSRRGDAGIMVGVRDLRGYSAVVGVSRSELPLAWREILGSALIIVPFVILLAFWGARVLAGNVLEPVDRIRQEVEAITDGRSLHRRVAVDLAGSRDDEMTRLTTTLNAMIGRLETSFAALRRFTADASHELKTPLTVLRADVERAMTASTSSNDQAVALEEALQETARMSALVDSLLTLARADEGRFDLHREPVDLREIAQEVYETAVILGEPNELSVTMPRADEVTVLGDRLRLRQLFLNLAENATKYTPKQGKVQLALEREGETAKFSVKDTGIGISAADLPHVFERFWRADRARSRVTERGGNGLGLAICQWIAQAHGGELTVSSRLHRGSVFTATLPVAPEGTGAAGAGAEGAGATAPAPHAVAGANGTS
ncbi:MAG: HAMP domain-containing protein [Gemmatimonadetes bacterium]|nr:HAMP domain-containing protein [Gemmatimonadota bacterium]